MTVLRAMVYSQATNGPPGRYRWMFSQAFKNTPEVEVLGGLDVSHPEKDVPINALEVTVVQLPVRARISGLSSPDQVCLVRLGLDPALRLTCFHCRPSIRTIVWGMRYAASPRE